MVIEAKSDDEDHKGLDDKKKVEVGRADWKGSPVHMGICLLGFYDSKDGLKRGCHRATSNVAFGRERRTG